MALIQVPQPKPETAEVTTPITITSIEGAYWHSHDFSKVTCFVGSDIIVKGDLPIPEQALDAPTIFAMPISRNGQIEAMFPAEAENGKFTVTLNFDLMGAYVYSNEEANKDLLPGTFEVQTIKIDVMKSTAA